MPAAMRRGQGWLAINNLAGLVGQAAGRAAVPLVFTKAPERGDGGAGIRVTLQFSLSQYPPALSVLVIGKLSGETLGMDVTLNSPFAVESILCAK